MLCKESWWWLFLIQYNHVLSFLHWKPTTSGVTQEKHFPPIGECAKLKWQHTQSLKSSLFYAQKCVLECANVDNLRPILFSFFRCHQVFHKMSFQSTSHKKLLTVHLTSCHVNPEQTDCRKNAHSDMHIECNFFKYISEQIHAQKLRLSGYAHKTAARSMSVVFNKKRLHSVSKTISQ